jgi:hypothetical protein
MTGRSDEFTNPLRQKSQTQCDASVILEVALVSFQSSLAHLVARRWFWIAAVALLFGPPLLRAVTSGRVPASPPVIGSFPEFALSGDRGESVTVAALRGHVFIANALSPADASAGLSTMAALQHRTRNLGDAVWLVSFAKAFDPAALRELRRVHRAGQRWFLIAGMPSAEPDLFADPERLLLVDARSRIRGRYGARTAEDIERLLRDAALVAELR